MVPGSACGLVTANDECERCGPETGITEHPHTRRHRDRRGVSKHAIDRCTCKHVEIKNRIDVRTDALRVNN